MQPDTKALADALLGPINALVQRVLALEKRLDALPAPKDGAPGRDGRDGLPGLPGAPGAPGEKGDKGTDGRDGKDGAGFEYRGVYKDGDEYHRNEAATYGGSLWIVEADKTTSKPDAGDGTWRLAVKRGRDGRDGKDGAPGERGPQGEQGAPGRNGRNLG